MNNPASYLFLIHTDSLSLWFSIFSASSLILLIRKTYFRIKEDGRTKLLLIWITSGTWFAVLAVKDLIYFGPHSLLGELETLMKGYPNLSLLIGSLTGLLLTYWKVLEPIKRNQDSKIKNDELNRKKQMYKEVFQELNQFIGDFKPKISQALFKADDILKHFHILSDDSGRKSNTAGNLINDFKLLSDEYDSYLQQFRHLLRKYMYLLSMFGRSANLLLEQGYLLNESHQMFYRKAVLHHHNPISLTYSVECHNKLDEIVRCHQFLFDEALGFQNSLHAFENKLIRFLTEEIVGVAPRQVNEIDVFELGDIFYESSLQGTPYIYPTTGKKRISQHEYKEFFETELSEQQEFFGNTSSVINE